MLDEWSDADGTVWTRSSPRWMTESDAARLQLRSSTVVAVEGLGTGEPIADPVPGEPDLPDLTWLSPDERKVFWRAKVAGHLDAANGVEPKPNSDGVTFRASIWTDVRDRRLILISRFR